MKKVWILVAIVAIAAGAWLFNRKPDLPTVPFTKVIRENLVSTLAANGKVEPFEWSAVHAESAGLIDRTSVQQGQSVKAGAPLAVMRVSGVQADIDRGGRPDCAGARGAGRYRARRPLRRSWRISRTSCSTPDSRSRLRSAISMLCSGSCRKNAATRFEVEAARNKVTEAQIQIDAASRKKAALTNADDKSVAEAQLKQGEAAKAAAQKRAVAGRDSLADRRSGLQSGRAPRSLRERRRPDRKRGPARPLARARLRG